MKLLRFSCVGLVIVLGFLTIVASTPCPCPDGRFTDMGDGTVRDNDSGLIWLKCGGCTELPGTSNAAADWNYAIDIAAFSLADGLCGLTDGSHEGDWRIPTMAEWGGFFYHCEGIWLPYTQLPAPICSPRSHVAFCDLQWDHFYWSSDDVGDGTAKAVKMNGGGTGRFCYCLLKDERAFILLVRDPHD